ncbi:MobA/MobL family protein [Cytobacillus oceanisediminis]|uniref:MobQ family relaxase n=1 Tax=Cytobacillus oceanisediminis TaxID=665099 RepID=UPI001C2187A3|nr:MobQ family relaxase [Cytobacillus oceanisediminis]MBU8732508.1 MobA/MobL family protein [Cytobacillus oceanisediminis]
MSLFYLTVRNLNKGTQSAVAAAAYRSNESIYSERDNETKSYKEREVKPDSFILAPSHAPEWVNDREKLWNEVEKVEKNWNARLAREVLVALPIELSNEKQKEMLMEYVKENFVDEGMVADVSIHRDKVNNPHAHIMLTVRPFNEDGTWGNKKKKEYIKENGEYVLNEKGEKKYKTISLTNWDQKETLINWRKNFAEKVNEWYLKNGVNEKISHESYETQGIDKLPKQRLSLEEYIFEKRNKENAIAKGEEYKPKTFYAKTNQEIEKANKQIEKINNKVIELSDYRKKYQNEKVNKLNEIRKNASLSQEDWKALKVVAGRLNGFVDYQSATDNLVKLDNWKKNIDRQSMLLKAEENVLTKAAHIYKTEPSKVLLYGFNPTYFSKEFSDKASAFKEKKDKLNKTIDAFQELYSYSKRAQEIQREFVKEEFNFLYPQYAERLNSNSTNELNIKYKYVSLFKDDGTIKKSIPEIENNNLTNKDHEQLNSLIDEWKKVKHSLVILERTKEKRKAEYREAYQDYNADKVYSTSVKYNEAKEQIANKEKEKALLEQKLQYEMENKYPGISKEFISEIPPSIQSKVLELHLKGENTGRLSEDLKSIQNATASNQKSFDKKPDETKFEQEERKADVGGLLGALVNNAQRQEHHKDDLEAKRQRNKKQLYKELGEMEL